MKCGQYFPTDAVTKRQQQKEACHDKICTRQESIPVGCVLLAFLVPGEDLPIPPDADPQRLCDM